mmetsp:Transcript_14910/g.24383  ORF Transcript_14910/g.24383 Transcript_14910/m.24383 type:complete len:200 (-) Transcript_14910:457-1056(-)
MRTIGHQFLCPTIVYAWHWTIPSHSPHSIDSFCSPPRHRLYNIGSSTTCRADNRHVVSPRWMQTNSFPKLYIWANSQDMCKLPPTFLLAFLHHLKRPMHFQPLLRHFIIICTFYCRMSVIATTFRLEVRPAVRSDGLLQGKFRGPVTTEHLFNCISAQIANVGNMADLLPWMVSTSGESKERKDLHSTISLQRLEHSRS